jgi:hypothetical protein
MLPGWNRRERATFYRTPQNRRYIVADAEKKPEDAVPQPDKQAHTEIAEQQGREGEQAHLINKEEAEERKDS